MKKRTMKKWIPWHVAYCDDGHTGTGNCKWWKNLSYNKNSYILREKYCTFKEHCEHYQKDENCLNCNINAGISDNIRPEPVTLCQYLNVIEIGQYPLGDMCKICGVHEKCKYGW